MEQKKQETTRQLKIMCSKYIVLKKTGAAPLPYHTATPRETSLKEERRSLTRPLTLRVYVFFYKAYLSEIHYLHSVTREQILKFLFFPTPKQEEKRKIPLTANSKPHEQ